jgi:hypothetical protein
MKIDKIEHKHSWKNNIYTVENLDSDIDIEHLRGQKVEYVKLTVTLTDEKQIEEFLIFLSTVRIALRNNK